MILPRSGRFLVRRIHSQAAHLVGILHFGPEFSPVEGASYIAVFSSRTVIVLPEVIDAVIPLPVQGRGVDAMLRGPCWRRTSVKATICVRFLSAFPESNGWVVVGAANQPLLPAQHYSRDGHAWNDVLNGDTRPIASPANGIEYGATPGQMLANVAVWPDADGALHSLPIVESSWRAAHARYASFLDAFRAGTMDENALLSAMQEDPELAQMHPLADLEYCRALRAGTADEALADESPETYLAWGAAGAMAENIIASLGANGRDHTQTRAS